MFGIILNFPGFALAHQNFLMDPGTIKSTPHEQIVLIDTRSKFKYLLGHIPNAIHIGTWQDFTHQVKGVKGLLIENKQFIANKLNSHGISYKKSIILYGDTKDPWRTDGRFFWMFERFGFTKVAILEGGIDNWRDSGGNLEMGSIENRKPKSSLTVKDISLNNDITANQNWIINRIDSKNLSIIDNRTREEYDGSRPYGSPRGGHIPTAINIHWPDFFSPKGFMKSINEISVILDRYKIDRKKEIVVYCTGGVRSSMAYFVFRNLGYSVRNYDGSWWDWSQNPNLPVEIS